MDYGVQYCAVMNGDGINDGNNGNFTLGETNSSPNGKHPFFIRPTTFIGYPTTAEDSLALFFANWDISDSSALIDKGSLFEGYTLPDTCINGFKRISATIDIGAYEFPGQIETLEPSSVSLSGVKLRGKILTTDTSYYRAFGFKYSDHNQFDPNFEGIEIECTQLVDSVFSVELTNLDHFQRYYYVAFIKDSAMNNHYGIYKDFFIKNDLENTDGIFFVSQEYKGIGDGSSWENATANLSDAISAAQSGNQIWISKGIYRPNDFTDDYTSDQYFELKNGVKFYGGFAGNETSVDERIKADNDFNGVIEPWEYQAQTVLSADVDGIEDDYDAWPNFGTETTQGNGTHVFFQKMTTSKPTLINGFIIQGATNAGVVQDGKTTIENCIVRYNTRKDTEISYNGGGICNYDGVVSNCLVTNNYIDNAQNEFFGKGGGIFNVNGSVRNSKISNCSASGSSIDGGGIYNYRGKIEDCIVYNNIITGYGGGISTWQGSVWNCTVFNNKSKTGAIRCERDDIIVNCVVYNNVATDGVGGISGCDDVYNCTTVNNIGNSSKNKDAGILIGDKLEDMAKNCISTGNLNTYYPDDAQPMASLSDFKNPSTFRGIATNDDEFEQLMNADWSLVSSSSFINKGDSTLNLSSIKTDVIGNKRIYGPQIDLGAYEFQGKPDGINEFSINKKIIVTYIASRQIINIHNRDAAGYSVIVTDLIGRTYYKKQSVDSDEFQIDVSFISQGVYLVAVFKENEYREVHKIAIAK